MTPHTDPAGPRRRRSVTVPAVIAVVAGVVALTMAVLPSLGARPDGDAAERGPASSDGAGSDGAGSDGAGSDGPPVMMSDEPQMAEAYAELARLARLDPDDPMALGEVDAPVVMVSYSDFQCPFCGRYALETEPTLVGKYVQEGVLRIEWRDFPYLGPESTMAAHAARAAGEQDRFWDFHHQLYATQPPPNSGEITEEHLVGIARRLGLDVDRFRTDMDSPRIAAAVQEDFTEGMGVGVNGTPAFLVNGKPVMGAQPLEVFEQVVEEARAGSQR